MTRHSKEPLEQRRAKVRELRRQGLTFRAIGERMGISGARAQQLARTTVADRRTQRRREIEEHARIINAMIAAGLCE